MTTGAQPTSTERGIITRAVVITPEQDAFVSDVMRKNGFNRSQVVRLALDKLRADSTLFLSDNMSESIRI